MNPRENLVQAAHDVLVAQGYNVCHPSELPTVVGTENFPIASMAEPTIVTEGYATYRGVVYELEINMLMQRVAAADKASPYLAIIEQDAFDVAQKLAESDNVATVTIRHLEPVMGALTHVGEVSMNLLLRVEMFRYV